MRLVPMCKQTNIAYTCTDEMVYIWSVSIDCVVFDCNTSSGCNECIFSSLHLLHTHLFHTAHLVVLASSSLSFSCLASFHAFVCIGYQLCLSAYLMANIKLDEATWCEARCMLCCISTRRKGHSSRDSHTTQRVHADNPIVRRVHRMTVART